MEHCLGSKESCLQRDSNPRSRDPNIRSSGHSSEPCHEKTCLYHMQTTTTQIRDSQSVIRFLESIIHINAKSQISTHLLASVAEQAGLSLTWLKTSNDRFSHDVGHLMSAFCHWSSLEAGHSFTKHDNTIGDRWFILAYQIWKSEVFTLDRNSNLTHGYDKKRKFSCEFGVHWLYRTSRYFVVRLMSLQLYNDVKFQNVLRKHHYVW